MVLNCGCTITRLKRHSNSGPRGYFTLSRSFGLKFRIPPGMPRQQPMRMRRDLKSCTSIVYSHSRLMAGFYRKSWVSWRKWCLRNDLEFKGWNWRVNRWTPLSYWGVTKFVNHFANITPDLASADARDETQNIVRCLRESHFGDSFLHGPLFFLWRCQWVPQLKAWSKTFTVHSKTLHGHQLVTQIHPSHPLSLHLRRSCRSAVLCPESFSTCSCLGRRGPVEMVFSF